MNKLVINEWISMKEQLAKNNATEDETRKAVKEFINNHNKDDGKEIIEKYSMAYIKFMSGQYEEPTFWQLLDLEFEGE